MDLHPIDTQLIVEEIAAAVDVGVTLSTRRLIWL
jgi:hypothetical protein